MLRAAPAPAAPTELTEKSFLLDEELELPGGAPAVREMVSYQVRPMVTDAKVLGRKQSSREPAACTFLYMTPEDRLAVWDFELALFPVHGAVPGL